MDTKRVVGHAPRTRAVAEELIGIEGPCIGCKGCTGLCAALIEALSVPDVVLHRG
ncbi:hypothetical protein [Sagittula salina]|uniref:Uncharacterized protein n=1 Tax=Sagittula salina TaxID=2820268 RepID=A0A940S4H7_9RHOB|nr:hypothetical protein [Sagittula salina]MBP0484114.1 hypothetical protein [Sagittula salina]